MSTPAPLAADRPTSVAVVIPAKNEADRIEATIRAAESIDGVNLVVVVDDGSTDATAAVAMGADALVVRHKTNQGKAAAMTTGAQLVAMREEAARADGGEDFREELHAEPRVPGYTGPLPVIDPSEDVPRALLFLDADMGQSALGAQPLVEAVLNDGVDMAIALLPPQPGAAGMGLVVRTARAGIQRATGWEPTQPLSGTRCITRETWDACQPLAPGWGVETSLTIDALTGGFWVKEIECELHHRATGKDLGGQLHRAAQLKDVMRALARRRHVTPEEPVEEQEVPEGWGSIEERGPVPARGPESAEGDDAPSGGAERAPDAAIGDGADAVQVSVPQEGAAPPVQYDTGPADAWSTTADDDAEDRAERRAERRRSAFEALPVTGAFSGDQTRALGDVDAERLGERLSALPVEGAFEPDDVVLLADVDLEALAQRLSAAPVKGAFDPQHAVIIASHMDTPDPELPPSIVPPLTPDEYTSLVVHAAVDAGNDEH